MISFYNVQTVFEVVAAYIVEHDATIIRDDIPTVETP